MTPPDRDPTAEAAPNLEERLAAAERVCLMFGWMAGDYTDRGKAATELWLEWLALYRASGESADRKKHPDLSDEAVRELAARRDATVARTMEKLEAHRG